MSRKDMPSYVPRLNDLLGKEPILRGEDRDAHKSLQAAIQDALSPDDIFEEIAAREITSAIWEAQLYRKMKKKFWRSDSGICDDFGPRRFAVFRAPDRRPGRSAKGAPQRF
jgi:hypothetical protein